MLPWLMMAWRLSCDDRWNDRLADLRFWRAGTGLAGRRRTSARAEGEIRFDMGRDLPRRYRGLAGFGGVKASADAHYNLT